MKLYIAGPMRGIPEFNFPAFYEAQHELHKAGFETFSPAQKDVQRGFQFRDTTGHEEAEVGSGFSIREVMAIDTEWICKHADGVALLPGWHASKGARAEKALADTLGLPVKLVSQWVQVDATAAAETMSDPVNEVAREDLRTEPEPWWPEPVVVRNGVAVTDWDAPARYEPLGKLDGPKHFRREPCRERTPEEDAAIAERMVREFQDTPITESDPLENWDKAKVITQSDEVRITNAVTGGEKGQKLARFDLVPAGPLWKVAELYGKGAEKYADRNWEKGYAWSLSYGALLRHLMLFWQGESLDQETRCHHLTSVVFHAFALMQFEEQHEELDDRPRSRWHGIDECDEIREGQNGHD